MSLSLFGFEGKNTLSLMGAQPPTLGCIAINSKKAHDLWVLPRLNLPGLQWFVPKTGLQSY